VHQLDAARASEQRIRSLAAECWASARSQQRLLDQRLRTVLAAVAAMVVVALLAGVLLFFRPIGSLPPSGGLIGTGTSTATSVPLPTVVPNTCFSAGPGTPLPDNVAAPGPVNPPAPSGTPVDNSVAIGRQVTVQGVTITLERAYADATQTIVTYQTEGKNLWLADPGSPILIDSHGTHYDLMSVGGGAVRSA
jgi:hypothetical protein